MKAIGNSVLLIVGILLLALNMRPALASVAPLLAEIRNGLHLSASFAGVITTLPVLCFGVLAPAAPRLARRMGTERTLFGCMLGIAAGILLRVLGGTSILLIGTAIAGASIAMVNVLLPALVKRDFPRHPGAMTGIYTMVLGSGAAIAAGATVPLSGLIGHGWRWALAFWALPAVAAAVLWFPQMRRSRSNHDSVAGGGSVDIGFMLRSPLAWQLTVFMGMQSLTYYTTLSWLPAILRDSGFDAATAGLLLSISLLVGIPMALVTPLVATKLRDQRALAAALVSLTGTGFAGLLVAPAWGAYLWSVLLGMGLGGIFPLILTLMVLRTRNPRDTERLSSMSQSVGYILAAFGPFVMGALHDLVSNWKVPLLVLLVLLIPEMIGGVGAGRNVYLDANGEDNRRRTSEPASGKEPAQCG